MFRFNMFAGYKVIDDFRIKFEIFSELKDYKNWKNGERFL